MNVPLLDLKGQYAPIKKELLAAIEAVMESCQFINGPAVMEFEAQVARYAACQAAVGVSSGTDALVCALMTLGVGAGDEVITTPFTFFATAGSIWRVGAKPVFVDIEPDTYNIAPARIEAAVTPRTRAIMPVHLFGQMADMDPIMAVARKHKLFVIEDAAQAIGSTYKGRPAGSIGTAGCLSFFPTKNLGCLGDGGAITTQDSALAEKLQACRNHGSKVRYHHDFVGGNFRMDTIQAAALIVKLKYLDGWSAKRRQNAAQYNEHFAGFGPVVTPVVRECCQSIFNQYIIRVPRRNELQAFLKQEGIGTEVYYPLSMHQQECFKSLGHKNGAFPNSEAAQDSVLALPIYPELAPEQIAYVATKIKQFLKQD